MGVLNEKRCKTNKFKKTNLNIIIKYLYLKWEPKEHLDI